MGSGTSKSTLLLFERSVIAQERVLDALEKQVEALDKLSTWIEISVMIERGEDLSKIFMLQETPKELYNQEGTLISAIV
jgi:hypothetical protein